MGASRSAGVGVGASRSAGVGVGASRSAGVGVGASRSAGVGVGASSGGTGVLEREVSVKLRAARSVNSQTAL